MNNKKGNHQLISDTAKSIVRQFPMQLSQYQNNLDFILAAYRSENEKARTTPAPKFFAEKFLIDQNMLETPEMGGRPTVELRRGLGGISASRGCGAQSVRGCAKWVSDTGRL